MTGTDYKCIIHIFPNDGEMSEFAAASLAGVVRQNPYAVIGTATGGTPELTYKIWGESGVDASDVILIQLDQNIAMGSEQRGADLDYKKFVDQKIAGSFPGGKRPTQIYVLDGCVAEQRVLAKELQEKSHEYCRCGSEIEIGDDATGQLGEVKKEIARFNKILLANPRDLQVLGECPGRKPHLAFNDYRTNPEARTHLVELYKDTILANARFCGGDLSRSPRFALTQGPADIMEARQLLMLVSGEHKAEAVHSTFISNLGIEDLEEASARNIRLHDDVIVAMDMPAAKYIMGDLEKIKRSYDRMKKNCKIEVW